MPAALASAPLGLDQAVRLDQIAAIAGVARVIPIYEDAAGLSDKNDRRMRRIMVIAVPPDEIPLAIGDTRTLSRWLKIPHGFLFDRLSRPIFGDLVPGSGFKIDDKNQRMFGYVHIGPDLVVDGVAVMSVGDWLARHPDAGRSWARSGSKPGLRSRAGPRRNPDAACADDVTVMTPAELRAAKTHSRSTSCRSASYSRSA